MLLILLKKNFFDVARKDWYAGTVQFEGKNIEIHVVIISNKSYNDDDRLSKTSFSFLNLKEHIQLFKP